MAEQIFPEGFAEKIGQIMANPAMLQTVASLLPLISAAVKPPEAAPAMAQNPPADEIILDLPPSEVSEPEPPEPPEPSVSRGDYMALISALKPFLSPPRQERLDRISLLCGLILGGGERK